MIAQNFFHTFQYHSSQGLFDMFARTWQLILLMSTPLVVTLFCQPTLAYKLFVPQYTSLVFQFISFHESQSDLCVWDTNSTINF
jgi:hypothetical protein